MSVLFLAGVFVLYGAEQSGNPILTRLGTAATGNWEGKEARFGIAASALFATVTTDASCGAVNAAHDSLTPLGGLVPLFNMQTGEVIFGGVGAGMYGMLLFAILAVFIAGLMVGRTPEYIGKKIEGKEVKMAMLALIATSAAIPAVQRDQLGGDVRQGRILELARTARRRENLANTGPHAGSASFSTYSPAAPPTMAARSPGSAPTTPWYNLAGGLAMLIGRFLFIIPMLAVAGSLASKKRIPVTSGTLPTHGMLFVGLLVGTVVIVSALTFFPALSLSPIVEGISLMHEGEAVLDGSDYRRTPAGGAFDSEDRSDRAASQATGAFAALCSTPIFCGARRRIRFSS